MGEGVGDSFNIITGVGCEALPVTPESKEAQLLNINSTQHRMRANADNDIRRLGKKTSWKV